MNREKRVHASDEKRIFYSAVDNNLQNPSSATTWLKT